MKDTNYYHKIAKKDVVDIQINRYVHVIVFTTEDEKEFHVSTFRKIEDRDEIYNQLLKQGLVEWKVTFEEGSNE
jgi:hypothetical protein